MRKWVGESIVGKADVWVVDGMNKEVPTVPLDGLVVRDAMTDSQSIITPENIGNYQKSIDFTKRKAEEYGLDPEAAARRHIYRLTEGNPALRDQYFTKEEQAEMNALFQRAYGTPRELQPVLEKDGLIGKPNALYEHAVTDFDRIPEEYRTVKIEMPDGVKEFKTEAEARAFLEIEKKKWLLTDEQYQKAGVGILKHRSDARLNQYRSLDPVTQLYAYADDMGRLYANKKTLDTLETWRNDPKVGKELKEYFFANTDPLNPRKDLRLTLLDIYEMPHSTLGKIYKGADTVVTISRLAGAGKNLAQGTLTTGSTLLSKALINTLRQGSLGPIMDLSPDLRTIDNNVYRELEREGFVGKSTDYLGSDLGDSARIAIEIGTAQPIENFGRARASIMLMRNELIRNQEWLTTLGIDATKLKNDKAVIDAWNKFVKEWDPNRVLVSRTNILSDLDSMGNTSNQSRYDAPWAGRISKKFKSYFATTAGRLISDAKNIIDAVARIPEDGLRTALGQDLTKDSTVRIAELGAAIGIIHYTAYAFYKSQWDTDEMAEEKAGKMIEFTHGGKGNFILDPVWNAVSVPTPSILLWIVQDMKQIYDIKDGDQKVMAFVNALRKNITPLKDLDNAVRTTTGFDAMQSLSERLNTFNPKYMTQYGLARWYGAPEDKLESIAEWFGMRWDEMVERILYDKTSRMRKSGVDDTGVEKKWYDKAIDLVFEGIDRQAQNNQTWSNLTYLFGGKWAEAMQGLTQATDTWKAVTNLDKSKTEAEFFDRMGIPQNYRNLVRAEIYKMLETKFSNNQKVEESVNTTTFADRSLINDETNIDRANYFKRSPEEKKAYWATVNRIKPTAITPEQWLELERTDLELFNARAKDYIFEAPTEYPLWFKKTVEGGDAIDVVKELRKTDPRGYNDIVSYAGNFYRAMQNRVDDGLSPVPELSPTKESITKAHIKTGRFEFDPTQRMTQKQYTELLSDDKNPTLKEFLNGIRGSGTDTIDESGNLVFKQLRGAGQYSTPQDDAVIAQYHGDKALTTSISASIGWFIQKLQSMAKQWDKATDKLDYSKVEPKLRELEWLLQFVEWSGLATADFRTSLQSTLGNASNIWEKIKGLNIRDKFPVLYREILNGLQIRGESVSNVANIQKVNTIPTWPQKTWAPTSGKMSLSSMLWWVTQVTQIEGGMIPEKNKKKPAQLKDKFLRVESKPTRVMSLSELLRSKK